MKEAHQEEKNIDEYLLFSATCYIIIAMGIGHFIILGLSALNITIPAYLGPMMVAAVIRNYLDFSGRKIPLHSINVIGGIALQLFLAIALMTMNLWELSALALPLITILLVQTVIMAAFANYVTFRIMGKDYDAAVIATGQCGFGMGATPNAMANMVRRIVRMASHQRPFVVPLVGALFIDFSRLSYSLILPRVLTKQPLIKTVPQAYHAIRQQTREPQGSFVVYASTKNPLNLTTITPKNICSDSRASQRS